MTEKKIKQGVSFFRMCTGCDWSGKITSYGITKICHECNGKGELEYCVYADGSKSNIRKKY